MSVCIVIENIIIMDTANFPRFQQNLSIFPLFSFFLSFFASPTLTMVHLRIKLNTYWTERSIHVFNIWNMIISIWRPLSNWWIRSEQSHIYYLSIMKKLVLISYDQVMFCIVLYLWIYIAQISMAHPSKALLLRDTLRT